MSVDALIAVLKHSKATGAEQLVLLRLADLVNDKKGDCAWPGYAYLAKVTGYSRKHVMACAQGLEHSAELRIVRRIGLVNHFYITVGEPTSAVQVTSHLGDTSTLQVTDQCRVGDSTSVVQVTPPVPCRLPYPLSNPLIDTLSSAASGLHENGGIGSQEKNDPLSVATSAVQVTPPSPPKGVRKDDPRFEKFWAAYPKKRSKGDAEKAWHRDVRPNDALAEVIIGKVADAALSESWQDQGGKFIPFPATWLRAKGWLDEYTPIKKVRKLAL